MKILYGVNTNGQGHINRARVFVTQLLDDGHEVHVLFSGKEPPEYAYTIAPIAFYKPGLIDIYSDHKLAVNKSIQVNFANVTGLTRARRELAELEAKEDYDVIFSDFEPSSSILGRKNKKPVIGINRQHALLHPALENAPLKLHEKMGVKFAQSILFPHYNHCFALDFTDTIETANNITLFPLVWKREFDNYDISYNDYITVYLQWYEHDKIVKIFSKYPKETFYVYGFDVNKQIKNVHFKETSRENFLRDLTSCKAVIGGGGFNLTWEVCLINKLIWTIPYKGQHEQVINSYQLQKMGHSYNSEELTVEDLKNYLTWLENRKYQAERNLTILQPSDLMDRVYIFLDKYQQEGNQKRKQAKREIASDMNRWRLRLEIKQEINLENS